MRRLFGSVAATTLLLITALPVGAAAVRTPRETGCAAGFEQLSVKILTGLGYRAPALEDEGGNQDGWVCGHALEDAAADQISPGRTHTIYLFVDNVLTPEH
jgi:hypothetical protein